MKKYMDSYYGYNSVEVLKAQIKEEVKEKYALYKRIKELNDEVCTASNLVNKLNKENEELKEQLGKKEG